MSLSRTSIIQRLRHQSRPGRAVSAGHPGMQTVHGGSTRSSRKSFTYGLDARCLGFSTAGAPNDEIVDPTPGGGP